MWYTSLHRMASDGACVSQAGCGPAPVADSPVRSVPLLLRGAVVCAQDAGKPVESGYLDRRCATKQALSSGDVRPDGGGGGGAGAGARRRGYLAQHQLFEQIPALARDVAQPEYCALGEGLLQSVNAWLGPAGTVRAPC